MKTYLQISLLFCFTCMVFIGCSSEKDPFSSIRTEDCPALSIGNAENSYLLNHPYGIDSINMMGTCMNFAVAFSGGCIEDHIFDLWWDEEYETILTDEVKSVNAVLYLVHNNNGDYCEALVRSNYSFDISSIRHNDYGEVAIKIFSTDSIYLYQYRY